MRLPQLVLLGGVAALALAGVARAESPDTHVLNIRLPNGQIEQIRYTGDVPPTIRVEPMQVSEPVMVMADPFAIMRQISTDMDRQAEAMMRSAAVMMQQPVPGMTQAEFGPMMVAPVTIAAGPGVCMRSVQITYTSHGQPHVVSQSSGDCGQVTRPNAPVALPTVPPSTQAPRTIEARNETPTPYAGLIHTVSEPSQ